MKLLHYPQALNVGCTNFMFVWPCIITNFFVIKPTRCTNFTNLFCHETLHVSDSSSVHYQEFIHCTLSSGICHTAFEQDKDGTWSCSKAVYKSVWHILVPIVQWINSWWWKEELSETRSVSCQNKFVKLVHLVGFIIKKVGCTFGIVLAHHNLYTRFKIVTPKTLVIVIVRHKVKSICCKKHSKLTQTDSVCKIRRNKNGTCKIRQTKNEHICILCLKKYNKA